MSTYLYKLKEGDDVICQGPAGKIDYLGNNYFSLVKWNKEIKADYLSIFVCGTGITPIIQLFNEFKQNKNQLKIKLFFCNKTKADYIFKEELKELKTLLNLEIVNIFTREKDYEGRKEHFTLKYLKDNIFKERKDHLSMICGTSKFKKDLRDLMKDLNFNNDYIFLY